MGFFQPDVRYSKIYNEMNINFIENLELKGKRVIVRADLNVPSANGAILDTSRIEAIIPTITYLLQQKCKIVLISHFGSPKGVATSQYSLRKIAPELERLLQKKVRFIENYINEEVTINDGVTLLENLRFHRGETTNDLQFAQKLASLGDIYINEAFSCSHRRHASISRLAELMPSACGYLFANELSNLEKHLNCPKKPVAAIVGGAKISTKIGLVKALLDKAELVFVGGAMANTFLKAKGYQIGSSLFEEAYVSLAKEIIADAAIKNVELILPFDAVVAKHLDSKFSENVSVKHIQKDQCIFDVGAKTIESLFLKLQKYHTFIWNGTLGVAEEERFARSTNLLANKLAELTSNNGTTTVLGGGDTFSAINKLDLIDSFTYVSLSGGAFLEWLEGKKLPGISSLENNASHRK
jgi:phosphoglycerate kinase